MQQQCRQNRSNRRPSYHQDDSNQPDNDNNANNSDSSSDQGPLPFMQPSFEPRNATGGCSGPAQGVAEGLNLRMSSFRARNGSESGLMGILDPSGGRNYESPGSGSDI